MLPAYVQVQTPYDESWSSTTLYAVAFVELPFKLSAGEVTGYEQDGYSYYYYVQDSETEEWNAVESVSALYTVTVPTGTTELTLTFDEARIAYAYADMGVTYIASCAKDKTAGYANNGQTGETTAYVRPTDKRKLPAYVQVQTPYDESWSSTTLYAVTFVEALPSDAEGHWAEEYIRYVFDNGLMIGTGADTFAPEEPLTRAMLVTILYRLEGEPETAFDSRFDDVTEGKWYSDAVSWAAKEGLVLGYGDGTFGPAEPITREQFATILYRYAASGDSAAADLSAYEDADAISKWAKDAVTWAVGTGLIRGMTKTTLVPQGTSTRAQAAAILTRYLKA